jgi:hypothetical protein
MERRINHMKRIKNIFLPVFLVLLLIHSSSCSDIGKNTNKGLQPTHIDEQNIKSSYDNQLLDMTELEKSIKNLINDKIWYYGDWFYFNKFENRSFEMEIYIKKEDNCVRSVFICMYPEEEIYREEMGYTALMILNGQRGFHNELSIYFEDDNEADVVKKIEDLKYAFYCNGKIKIEKSLKPDYQSFENKDKIIQNIMNIIPEELELLCFNSGKYKVYIRDFRKNDYRTYVVIEDDGGNIWLEQILISDNNEVGTGRIYDLNEEDSESLRKEVIKYKEVAVKEIDIYIP